VKSDRVFPTRSQAPAWERNGPEASAARHWGGGVSETVRTQAGAGVRLPRGSLAFQSVGNHVSTVGAPRCGFHHGNRTNVASCEAWPQEGLTESVPLPTKCLD
jgi:hypothetical protein